MNQELRNHVNAMLSGVEALSNIVTNAVEDTYKKMSPEDAAKFAKALKDGGIERIAKENAERLEQLKSKVNK